MSASEPLDGTVTPLEAMRALAGMAPAVEVIDSRYRDFRFSLPDVVADNCSAAAIVVGPWSDPATDVGNLGLLLEVLPPRIRQPIEEMSDQAELLEVVMDLGRLPEARLPGREVRGAPGSSSSHYGHRGRSTAAVPRHRALTASTGPSGSPWP